MLEIFCFLFCPSLQLYIFTLSLEEFPGIVPATMGTLVLLSLEQFCPLGDIWQHVEAFLVVTSGGAGATSM